MRKFLALFSVLAVLAGFASSGFCTTGDATTTPSPENIPKAGTRSTIDAGCLPFGWTTPESSSGNLQLALNAANTMVATAITLPAQVTVPSSKELWIPGGGSVTLGNFNLVINGGFNGSPGCFIQNGGGVVIWGGTSIVRQIRPEWWGVIYDGTPSGGTDNATALAAMYASLNASSHDITWQIDLPPNGYMKYSFNGWTRLKNVILDCHNSTIQNISNNVYAYPRYPLTIGGYGCDYFTNTYNSNANYGYLINDTHPGDTTVTLQSSANKVNFYVGGAALVYSYETQYGGYPPEARFYDIARIMNINGATLTLDTPIRYFHSSNWPEVPGIATNKSKARIVPIDRKDSNGNILNELGHYNKIRNCIVADNPNLPPSSEYFMGNLTENFIVENVTANQFQPSQCKNFWVRGGKFTYTSDLDKFMDTGLIEENENRGFVGVGPKNLTVRNSRVHGPITTHADALTLEGNTSDYAVQPGNYRAEVVLAWTKDAVIRANHFFGKNGATDSPINSYGGYANPIQIAGSTTISNNYTVQMPLSGNSASQAFLDKIQIGSIVFAGPYARGFYETNNNFGVVHAIRDDGDSGATCQVDILFTQTVNTNDYIVPVNPVSADIWANTYTGIQPLLSPAAGLSAHIGPALGRQENSLVDGKYKLQFIQDINSNLHIIGRVSKIVVDVVTPYTGISQSNAYFNIKELHHKYNGIDPIVNLKVAGRREINMGTTVNGQTGDTLTALPATNFANKIAFFNSAVSGSGHAAFTDPPYQMAVVNVTIETDAEMFKQF